MLGAGDCQTSANEQAARRSATLSTSAHDLAPSYIDRIGSAGDEVEEMMTTRFDRGTLSPPNTPPQTGCIIDLAP